MKKENKKRHDHIYNLTEFIISEATLDCTKCDQVIDGYSEDDLADEAYNGGWRATDNNVYCPKCVKKYKIKR